MSQRIMVKRYAIIDVGSNSIRLMIIEGGLSLCQSSITTRLGSGLIIDGNIHKEEMCSSVNVIKEFVNTANSHNAEIHIFGTAAVRRALNADEFISILRHEVNCDIHVLSGIEEAKIGYIGAIYGQNNANCSVIDIGGASSEIAIGENGAVIDSISLDIGAVKVYAKCGVDYNSIEQYVKDVVDELKLHVAGDVIAIGGTATSVAMLLSGGEKYSREITHGYVIEADKLDNLINNLLSMGNVGRSQLHSIKQERREIIVGGAVLLREIMRKLDINTITTSENDNLIGYYEEYINEK